MYANRLFDWITVRSRRRFLGWVESIVCKKIVRTKMINKGA